MKRYLQQDYWRIAQRKACVKDYPDIIRKTLSFPDRIAVTYVQCVQGCGSAENCAETPVPLCYNCGLAMKPSAASFYRRALPEEIPPDEPFAYEVSTESDLNYKQKRRPRQRQYWKTVLRESHLRGWSASAAPRFPETVYIAYAVCSRRCGFRHFLIEGSSQICPMCGGILFRTETAAYILDNSENILTGLWLDLRGRAKRRWLRKVSRMYRPHRSERLRRGTL